MSNEESTESVKNDLKKLQNELAFSKERISKLEKELASAKSAGMKFERDNEKLNKKVEELTNENSDLNNQIKNLEVKIKNLATEALEQELKTSNDKILELETRIKQQNDELATLSKDKKENINKIEDQQKDINARKDEIKTLSTKIKELEISLKEKDTTIESLNSTITELNTKLAKINEKLLVQSSQLEEHALQVKDVTEVIETAKQTILSKDATIEELKNTFKEQKNKTDELQIALDKIQVEKQEQITKITELENTLELKENDIEAKTEKIKDLTNKLEQIEVGVDLYQNTIKELKNDLEKRNNEIDTLKERKEAGADIERYEKLLTTKDKTISILKKEISDLNARISSFGSTEEKEPVPFTEMSHKDGIELLDGLAGKISEPEYNKLMSIFKDTTEKLKDFESFSKKQKGDFDKLKHEAEKSRSEITKYKADINKLKSELKDKDKELKQLQKNIDRSEKMIKDLQSEVDLESAISQIEEKKESFARIDELNKLRERIDLLEENLDWEKQQNAELQKKCAILEQSTDAQSALEQKNTYEQYILTIQTELYDIKHKLDESEALRNEQQVHIDRLEALIAEVTAQIDQQAVIPSPELVQQPAPQTSSPPLLGQTDDSTLPGRPNISPPRAIDTTGLLGNRKISPIEAVEQERNDQLMEFYKELSNKVQEIRDIAFIGFDGKILFKATPWNIKSDIFKLIQDWKAESAAIWLNEMKYATIKATDDILVATNVEGKGHLLCAALDEKLFMICDIDIKGDALLLYEDLEPMLPHLKNIFDAYEQKKDHLL
ncbi:MAG: hypothetical protein EU536_03655 [Promethearchaeota archaeon]|nr:MAG: hypothetical protein EU536_03655 [Candidatus Lokiarchaeota archaeon]